MSWYLPELSKLIKRVLSRFKEAGLKLKPSKCKFAENRVDYLGFSISDQGRQPSRRKVEALLKVEPPNTNKALMSFLLSINYYRSDIPRFIASYTLSLA